MCSVYADTPVCEKKNIKNQKFCARHVSTGRVCVPAALSVHMPRCLHTRMRLDQPVCPRVSARWQGYLHYARNCSSKPRSQATLSPGNTSQVHRGETWTGARREGKSEKGKKAKKGRKDTPAPPPAFYFFIIFFFYSLADLFADSFPNVVHAESSL